MCVDHRKGLKAESQAQLLAKSNEAGTWRREGSQILPLRYPRLSTYS